MKISKLKVLRERKELTQTEIAEKLNIPQSTYSNYENGISEPDLDMLIRIAKLYEISIDSLLGINYKVDSKIVESIEEAKLFLTTHNFKNLIINKNDEEIIKTAKIINFISNLLN